MADIPWDHDPIELGSAIRNARTLAGMSTQDVANRLKLREAFVIAVEEGRAEDLMPTAYARNHIRTIAALVGVEL